MNEDYEKFWTILEATSNSASTFQMSFNGFEIYTKYLSIECSWIGSEESQIQPEVVIHFCDDEFVIVRPDSVRWLYYSVVSEDCQLIEAYDNVEIMISEDEKTVTVCLCNGEVLDIHISESKDTELSEVA
ncbi:hypothetical protein RF542_27240 [Pseudomonas aeruginosa]